MHVAEVDLNYTQYCPLAETYVSLYPPKEGGAARLEESNTADISSKPPMWKEVEKCMEDGTLDKLRNRRPKVQVQPVKIPEKKPVKASDSMSVPRKKVQVVEEEDTTGLNRRQRRARLFGKTGKEKTKNKSMGFLKNQAFGSWEAAQSSKGKESQDDEDSDGGFFEE